MHIVTEKKNWENHRQALDGASFEISLNVLREVLKKFQEMNGNKDFADAVGGITETDTYIGGYVSI
jgi:uncharacterized protein YfiM (DUF2279 family)